MKISAKIAVIGTILSFAGCSLFMARPQEPKERNYPVREVVFNGGTEGVTLAGEVTMPPTNGPFPAVVFIAGSGPHDRDENVAAHKVFLVLSDYLTRRGYLVLRYDKRGIGKSFGDYQTVTMADFAGDAAAAMRWLKTQDKVDAARTGFLGHSSGGYVAPLAAQEVDAAFLVLLAAPARELAEELYYQNTVIPGATGKDEKWRTRNLAAVREFVKICKSAETPAQLREQYDVLFEKYRKDLGLPDDYVDQSLELIPAAWWMWAFSYDPVPALETYPDPVIALFGDKDLQVCAETNGPLMAQLLSHQDSKVMRFPGLNHLFQPAKTGVPDEYAWIETTFDPGAMEAIANWLDGLTAEK